MQISISIKGIDRLTKRLDPVKVKEATEYGVKALTNRFENRVGLEANQTVYSYRPKTQTYNRTGRLLGGRGKAMSGGKPYTKKLSPETYKVEANPQLKGANFNYAPKVNNGDGWMKNVGPRPFWDNAVKWTETKGKQQTLKEMKKKLGL